MRLRKFLFKLPVILVLVIGFVVLFGQVLPLSIQQFFYSLSLTINELLLFVLPFIIFSLLFSSIISMSGQTLWLILLLVPALCFSNFTATFGSYFIGKFVLGQVGISTTLTALTDNLQPLWQLTLPKYIPNEAAMLSALVLGLCFSVRRDIGRRIAKTLSNIATVILQKGFIPIIPLFILGFLLKLQYDDVLVYLIQNYAVIFLAILIIQVCYVMMLYGFGSKLRLNVWWQSIKSMLPAGVTGFTTMSSAAALPFTLIATEKNTNSKQITRLVIPTTVNIHLIGDCIAIPILALAIMNSFNIALPNVQMYFVFACYFVLAKFAVAAVPGGGIIVMAPVLAQQLGFNSEMISLITALYIMFDSVITSMNVMGNGAFAILFKNIFAGFYTDDVVLQELG